MAVAGDVYLRLTRPFAWNVLPSQFVPGIGIIRKPNAEVRYTNGVDFWTVSRTNSLGFLDREPPSHERAVESCCIAIIGDSFVEASEVSIAEKFQVRLEELASRAIPEQDITTSAFGIRATGQIAIGQFSTIFQTGTEPSRERNSDAVPSPVAQYKNKLDRTMEP